MVCLFEVSSSYHSRVTVYHSWLIIDEVMSNIARLSAEDIANCCAGDSISGW